MLSPVLFVLDITDALKMLQLGYLKACAFSPHLYLALSASLVCLLQFSGQCTAQLFSRWSLMIRELLEDIILLKCSTAGELLELRVKVSAEDFGRVYSFLKQILQIQSLNLSLSTSKQAAICLVSFFLSSGDR